MVKPTNANSEIEVINDGTMIKFKDVESYENALLKVSAMSTSEQVSFLNSLSFKSQMILMQEADGELDKICNQAADKAEFDVLYEKYKHKYGDVDMNRRTVRHYNSCLFFKFYQFIIQGIIFQIAHDLGIFLIIFL